MQEGLTSAGSNFLPRGGQTLSERERYEEWVAVIR